MIDAARVAMLQRMFGRRWRNFLPAFEQPPTLGEALEAMNRRVEKTFDDIAAEFERRREARLRFLRRSTAGLVIGSVAALAGVSVSPGLSIGLSALCVVGLAIQGRRLAKLRKAAKR